MVLNLGSYYTFNRVIRKIFETVPLIESLFYVVNSSKIQKYDLFSMRSYCMFNRVILKNVQTVRLIETWLIIETIEYPDVPKTNDHDHVPKENVGRNVNNGRKENAGRNADNGHGYHVLKIDTSEENSGQNANNVALLMARRGWEVTTIFMKPKSGLKMATSWPIKRVLAWLHLAQLMVFIKMSF